MICVFLGIRVIVPFPNSMKISSSILPSAFLVRAHYVSATGRATGSRGESKHPRLPFLPRDWLPFRPMAEGSPLPDIPAASARRSFPSSVCRRRYELIDFCKRADLVSTL